ncbi:hypothetical protein IQ235_18495 [Oscillatoriales cyanobacterium LEGE 11467]|uniref:Uncharacterized protein n=1 Tax=Zarconia navalis LEGE 11467 TaxID=1828826 RepID=A0A928W0Q4_9CYAN|nr:hypothetical protein [Zarconia navalis]MBE9042753.1 hypothetical protein [Zarconia navalis LEGE 11467]
MSIISLKAWYLRQYEPLRELEKRPHDLRLSKNSLLKSGLRADFLEESETIRNSEWFRRYLDGEVVEFYVEGSGGYAISNIDLSSHEIYFTKQEVMAHLEPTLFFCYQTEYGPSGEALRTQLTEFIKALNARSRIPLTLEESQRSREAPLRLNSRILRKIRKSLIFIADTTPIAQIPGETPQLLPSPNVCVEIGYAMQSKRTEQILLTQMKRNDLLGQLPFDLPTYQQLEFQNAEELGRSLPTTIETMLQRFSLLS